MLGKADATPMIAVKDLDRARKFYEETLGLEAKQEMGGEVLTVKSGRTPSSRVYRSEFAGTNKATALTFEVDDIERRSPGTEGQGHLLRAIRPSGADSKGRHLRRRGRLQDRLVQGPGREHPEP